MVTDAEREHAWGAVHDALARMTGWAVGPCTYHGDGALWHVTAIDLRPRGRYTTREAITATGATEIEALRALVALLEARRRSGRSASEVNLICAPAPRRPRRSRLRATSRRPGVRGPVCVRPGSP